MIAGIWTAVIRMPVQRVEPVRAVLTFKDVLELTAVGFRGCRDGLLNDVWNERTATASLHVV